VTPPPLETAPAPPEAVHPPPAPTEDPAGWARLGGGAGLALAAVPLGFAVAYTVTSWRNERVAPDVLLLSGGLTAPLCALLPTFGGRSAVVPDDLAHKPRLLRIMGWIMVVMGAIGLVAAPAYDQLFTAIGWGGPSVFGTVSAFLDAALASGGIASISAASLISAQRAGQTPEQPPAQPSTYQARVMPSVMLTPSGAAIGLRGSF
jgi:hypothetical protein